MWRQYIWRSRYRVGTLKTLIWLLAHRYPPVNVYRGTPVDVVKVDSANFVGTGALTISIQVSDGALKLQKPDAVHDR